MWRSLAVAALHGPNVLIHGRFLGTSKGGAANPEFATRHDDALSSLHLYVAHPLSLRRNSNKTMPAATETLSEDTSPAIGILTKTSQCF
jgi:hypothetical protein